MGDDYINYSRGENMYKRVPGKAHPIYSNKNSTKSLMINPKHPIWLVLA